MGTQGAGRTGCQPLGPAEPIRAVRGSGLRASSAVPTCAREPGRQVIDGAYRLAVFVARLPEGRVQN
jgi:hypothetical protein